MNIYRGSKYACKSAKPRATIDSLTMARKSKCVGGHIGLSPTGFVALGSAASSFIAARHARVDLQVCLFGLFWARKIRNSLRVPARGGQLMRSPSSFQRNEEKETPSGILDIGHVLESKVGSIGK